MTRYLILAFAAAIPSIAMNVVRQGSYSNTTSSMPSDTSKVTSNVVTASTKHAPAGTANVGTASVTNSANRTISTSSSATSAPNTCCYLYPRGVGINTWWSSSVDITVATVITTWLKYNNTIIPGNSTTKTVVNASSIFGTQGVPSVDFTEVPVSATATTTRDQCSAWDEKLSCTAPFTTVITRSAYSTVYYNTSNIVSGVPNSLLPANAALYGATSIDQTSVATFPSQTLAIKSPTPYYLYDAIDVFTSRECQATKTYTSLTTTFRTTIAGEFTHVTAVVPTATVTDFEGSSPINAGNPGDLYLNHTVAMPFPDGDYSDFNFTQWAAGVIIGPAPGPVDAYMFLLPVEFPTLLDSLPAIKSEYPDIGKCTNFAGDGEPTVHVQVNQLTDTSHVTQTMNGNLNNAGTTRTSADAELTKESPFSPKPVTAHVEESNTGLVAPSPPPSAPQTMTAESNSSPTAELPVVAVPDSVLTTESPSPTPTGQQQQSQESHTPDEQPIGTTTAAVGDIIASIIGLVPQVDEDQDENPQEVQVPPGPAVITVAQSTVTANDASAFVIGTQTAAPGGPAITEGGNTISVAPAGTAVVVNGITSPIEQQQAQAEPQQQAPVPQITVGGSVITADSSSRFVVGSQTLAPGGAPVTVDGDTFSLASSANAIVVNGETRQFQQQQVQTTPAPEIVFRGDVITANSASGFVIDSQTLIPGGSPITVDGTTLSLAPFADVVMVNGQRSHLVVPVGAPVTIAGEAATPVASGVYVLADGQTLSAGGEPIVVDGTTVAMASDGNMVIHGVTSSAPTAGIVVTSAQGNPDEPILPAVPGTTLLPGSTAVKSGTRSLLPSVATASRPIGEDTSAATTSSSGAWRCVVHAEWMVGVLIACIVLQGNYGVGYVM